MKDRCSKLTYHDGKTARAMAKKMSITHGVYTRAYQCDKCKEWHMTTETLRDYRKKNK